MPVVPSFAYDLFVSYAHRNDVPWKDGHAGWVTEFVKTLRTELEAKNRNFTAWFDPQLRSGEDYPDAINLAISRSALFLSILSPAYHDCPYCKREVHRFREQRHPAFGMKVGTLSRMQGIVLEDLESDWWPAEIRTTTPYRFLDSNRIRLNKPVDPDERHPYVIGVSKVRESIWTVLAAMQDQKQRGTVADYQYDIIPPAAGSPVIVLLADVPDDLFYRRERLCGALKGVEGLEVRLLENAATPPAAALSLHLFGGVTGRPAPGSDKPLSVLQLQAALEANPARRPLVWLARDVTPDHADTPSHVAFLTSLLDDSRIELLRVSFEDLKDEIQRRLPATRAPERQTVRRARPDPIVHIWHRSNESAPVAPLKQYLKERRCGISVFADLSPADAAIQSKLAFCDGLIVPYTHDTKSWAEDVMLQTLQIRRREERPLAFAAVALPPPSDMEFNFDHPKVLAIKATGQGQFDGIDQFLARLEELDG